MNLLLSTLAFSLLTSATLLAQGPLSPTAAPGPTMKSLDQIEPRRPLIAGSPGVSINASGTIIISQAGSYYLTSNLTVTSGNGVNIGSSDVTLDLNGFTISSGATGGHGVSIFGANRTFIHNGHIKGSFTFSGGSFSGTGFTSGIDYTILPVTARVKDVTVDGVNNYGIDLGTSESSIVESCVVRVASLIGIRAGIVADSAALLIGSTPISATTTTNCIGKKADGTATTSNSNSPQADQRVPISVLPYTIILPGSYYLTKSLSVSTGDGIVINASNVTLDLNGFTITSNTGTSSGYGVLGAANQKNINVRNGSVVSGVIVSGSNFSGAGFLGGIHLESGVSGVVENVRVNGTVDGIICNSSGVVRDCVVEVASGSGIEAAQVSGCKVNNVKNIAIQALIVSHCSAISIGDLNSTSVGIRANQSVDSSYARGRCGIDYASNSGSELTVSNSVGVSFGAGYTVNPYGIAAFTVLNSVGSGFGTFEGIFATCVTNSQGTSPDGNGIEGQVVTSSCGFSTYGTGIKATLGNGSYGFKSNPNGAGVSSVVIYKYNMP